MVCPITAGPSAHRERIGEISRVLVCSFKTGVIVAVPVSVGVSPLTTGVFTVPVTYITFTLKVPLSGQMRKGGRGQTLKRTCHNTICALGMKSNGRDYQDKST